jgi:hypothetical protein
MNLLHREREPSLDPRAARLELGRVAFEQLA